MDQPLPEGPLDQSQPSGQLEPVGPSRPEAADGEWHRVHPISPWVRGWVVLVAMIFFGSQSFGEEALRAMIGQGEFQTARGLWITMAIYGVVFVVMVVIYYFSWRFTKYQLADEQVLLDTGVIFRQHRRVRYDRVQAVDIRQPLLARIFGLAELKFEAADGGTTAMQLSFIKEPEARVLRAEIMGRAAGIQTGTRASTQAGTEAETTLAGPAPAGPGSIGAGPSGTAGREMMPDAPERVMLQVPVGRLIGSVLLSTSVLVMASALVLTVVAVAILESELPAQDGEDGWWFVLLFGMLPFVLSLVSVVWSGFNKGYNFTVATSPDGMRLRYGLLETTQQTVPPGRVQAVRISQGLLWRLFGWYKVVVNVAGYGPSIEGGSGDKSTVLPVGTVADVMRVLAVVAPDPGLDAEDAPTVIREGITGRGDGHGFTSAPRRVRWLDPLTWRRNAYRSTRTLLMLRSGRLERYLTMIPHERIQSVDLHQGPLLRRLSVATLRFHSTPGPAAPRLIHADQEVAARLFLAEAEIAAVSRRMLDRNQWMRPEELERFEQRARQAVQS